MVAHYRDSQFDMYPIHTGDLRSVIKPADFYSARQWHSTAMYTDFDRLMGQALSHAVPARNAVDCRARAAPCG